MLTFCFFLSVDSDGTMEMQKYSLKPVDNTANAVHTDTLYHKNKWRAERNFYLAAFTWTLLVILLRFVSF